MASCSNPADLPSRGLRFGELIKSSPWWHGPIWLQEYEDHWPPPNRSSEPSIEAEKEIKKKETLRMKPVESTLDSVAQESEARVNLELLINPKYYSSTMRLYKVTALVKRFVNNLKCKSPRDHQYGVVTTQEIEDAENLWFQTIQRSIVEDKRFTQLQKSLGLFSDELNVLRCKGRITKADIPYETKNPVILPNHHHLTATIIRECHERVFHNGVQDTLCNLRERFWIVRGRQTVKREVRKCVTCRRFESKPYASPLTAGLPTFRITQDFPFSYVGVDFAGPIFVKSVARKETEMAKGYIALYTCATTRAIHLELVPNLTADAFIRSFRRFISRRGIPKLMVSDNAKTFKSSSNKLSALFELPEVQGALQSSRIHWKFILEKAPWWGGFWERMVKSSKRCLKKILKNSRLSYDELNTILVEIEAVLNSRPLTYVESDET